MAIFQNVLSFFQPTPRRPGQAGGGRGVDDSATQRVLEGVEAALAPYNVPNHVADYLADDLKSAFDIKGPLRPVYEPGRIRARFKLVDFVTDPLKATWDTVGKPFKPEFSKFLYTPDDFLSQVNDAVWEYLYTTEWKGVVPYSTMQTIARWGETNVKGKPKILRHLAAQGVRNNPGMIQMKAHRIEMYFTAEFRRTMDPKLSVESRRFRGLDAEAGRFEGKIRKSLRNAERLKEAGDKLARAGKIGRAREAWSKADAQWSDADKERKLWNKDFKDARSDVTKEFKKLSRKGGPLYDSSEASFVRYWESRNKHYAALQFLRTYKEEGFGEAVKVYGWGWLTNKIKDVYYASKLNDALNSIAEKLGVTKLLGKLAGAQTFVKRLRAGFWLREGLKKAGSWLVKKLALAPLIGSIMGPAGTMVGAVVGAVVQFAGEIILEKLGGTLKILGYVLAGVIGVFGIFVIGIVVLISTFLANIPYPWEAKADEIDCNQAATATTSCVKSKSEVKSIADRWGVNVNPDENHVNECYNDVIAKSKSAGVDPRIAMAIWLNESNASNYELYKRLGVPPEDFGIPSQKGKGFTVQINSFFGFYKSSHTNYASCYTGRSDSVGFFRAFCTAGRASFGVGSCPNLTSVGDECVNGYVGVYNTINAGGSCN